MNKIIFSRQNLYRVCRLVLLLVISTIYMDCSAFGGAQNEKTNKSMLFIVKPDATEKNVIGRICTYFESNGFKITALKMIKFTQAQAMEFYREHHGKNFYQGLCDFMSSGPIVVGVVEGESISKFREIIGSTNPKEAMDGTIRKEFGSKEIMGCNAVHGSDSEASAQREISFCFNALESCK